MADEIGSVAGRFEAEPEESADSAFAHAVRPVKFRDRTTTTAG